MSRGLRYKNPIVVNHLASQYVVGDITPNVRSRIASLRIEVIELDTAIINWSESFSSIHQSLPEKKPALDTWNKVEQTLFKPIHVTKIVNKDKPSIWDSLLFWRFTGMGASMASLVLVVMLFLFPSQQTTNNPIVNSTPSYLAVMTAINSIKSDNDISFVVNAYQKTKTSPSKLFIQWPQSQPRSVNEKMHLWAQDKTTGELSYIGIEPDQGSWNLNKQTWQAIANSGELLFTKTSDKPSEKNTLFSGPCIQLGSWKQNTT